MSYAIVWDHFGLVTAEAHDTNPGEQYLVETVAADAGKVGAVLYETNDADALVHRVNGDDDFPSPPYLRQRALVDVNTANKKIEIQRFSYQEPL